MLVGEVHDGVGVLRAGAEGAEVVEVAPVDHSAEPGDDRRRLAGPDHADDLVTCGDQLGDDRTADEAGRSCDEDAHILSNPIVSSTLVARCSSIALLAGCAGASRHRRRRARESLT
ncbi:hypothetical protein GCM10009727_41300 [Actinomadura napierensis]|uniref:Uncharacterized protein n=1 Tax=Actinomadura napierensis TaxID=267854 RepID=A0ABP5LBX0_9ACTN